MTLAAASVFVVLAVTETCPPSWCATWTCDGAKWCSGGQVPKLCNEASCEAAGAPATASAAPAAPSPATAAPFIDFAGRDGKLTANGLPFKLKGINWFGMENINGRAPFGLHARSLRSYMKFLSDNGFNSVRLFFNHESILQNRRIPASIGGYGYTDAHHVLEAPELIGETQVGMVRRIAEAAAEYHILLMPVAIKGHPKTRRDRAPAGLWYEPGTSFSTSFGMTERTACGMHSHLAACAGRYEPGMSEHDVMRAWEKLAAGLCRQWNVFAVDLQNEPWAASWGDGSAKDWSKAAGRLGSHILSKCARWLILVEGVGNLPGAANVAWADNRLPFWGENLRGVPSHGVRLSDPSKLVRRRATRTVTPDPSAFRAALRPLSS